MPHTQERTMATMTPTPTERHKVHHAIDTMRWAPAPRWEGTAGTKTRFAVYLVASVAAWIGIGLGVAAGIGGLTGMVG
jgi:hypothetical protein